MKLIFSFLFICLSAMCFAQEIKTIAPGDSTLKNAKYYTVKDTVQDVIITPADDEGLWAFTIAGLFDNAKSVTFKHSGAGYAVNIPSWLSLKGTGDRGLMLGTLPEVKDIENAISVKAVGKNNFKTFADFKFFIVEDSAYRKSGALPAWSDNMHFISVTKVNAPDGKYSSYKAVVQSDGHQYYCNYILVETNTAYLWINFVATAETYDINIQKLYDFVAGLKITN